MAQKKPKYPSHLFIPDTQVKPDVPLEHLKAAGNFILEKRPDVIIHAGDHWDLPSLSSYDSPAIKGFDQRDFDADVEVGNHGLVLLDRAVERWNKKQPKRKQYRPRKVMLVGNHEDRAYRAARQTPWLRSSLTGKMETRDWEVVPFLEPMEIDGVYYCHYWCLNAHGQVTNMKNGQANARLQVQRVGHSATAGHRQGLDVHIQSVPNGTRRRGLIAGSFYMHDEDYMGPQGQHHWRGIISKHEVHEGDYALNEVPLDYLLRKYL